MSKKTMFLFMAKWKCRKTIISFFNHFSIYYYGIVYLPHHEMFDRFEYFLIMFKTKKNKLAVSVVERDS